MSERSFDAWRRFVLDDSLNSGPRVARPPPVGAHIPSWLKRYGFELSRLTNEQISAYYRAMRRKAGSLVPLELDILETAIALAGRGIPEVHGFLLARELQDQRGARRLTGYGTLYRALERLERMGYLERRWEDPQVAAEDGRPRRRFYRVTVVGERAARDGALNSERAGHGRPAAVIRT